MLPVQIHMGSQIVKTIHGELRCLAAEHHDESTSVPEDHEGSGGVPSFLHLRFSVASFQQHT